MFKVNGFTRSIRLIFFIFFICSKQYTFSQSRAIDIYPLLPIDSIKEQDLNHFKSITNKTLSSLSTPQVNRRENPSNFFTEYILDSVASNLISIIPVLLMHGKDSEIFIFSFDHSENNFINYIKILNTKNIKNN